MDALHVVGLAERLDADLPVGGQRDGDERDAAEVVRPDPLAVRGYGGEVLVQRPGRCIEVDEHQRAPGVDLHRDQRELVVAQHTEALARRHLAQASSQIPRPTVVGATDLGHARTRSVTKLVAAMQAHVLVGAQLTVVTAHDEDRVVADCVLKPVTVVRDVVDRAGELPRMRPHLGHLELRPRRVGVAVRRYAHRAASAGDARDGAAHRCVVCVLAQNRLDSCHVIALSGKAPPDLSVGR